MYTRRNVAVHSVHLPRAFVLGLATLAALAIAAGCNPNYCADHENNDCRADKRDEEPECATSADCAGKEGKAACDLERASCVECTAADAAACSGICSNNTCVACTSHDSCGSNACLPDGTCGSDSNVAYVAASSLGGSVNPLCSRAMPCSTLKAAVDTGKAYVRVRGEITVSTSLDGAVTTILGEPGAKLHPMQGPALELKGKSQVEIRDLALQGGSGAGGNALFLSGAGGPTARLIRCTLLESEGAGIRSTSGQLQVYQSKILKNRGGGLVLTGTSFDISNTVIAGNGSSESSLGGALFNEINTEGNRFEFNTVAENLASRNAVPGAFCASGSRDIIFSNNIVYQNVAVNAPGQVAGALCTPRYSNIGPTGTPSPTNINVDPEFVDTNRGDYHLKVTSAARNAADPAAKQPTDIDNDPRSDTRADIGADEVM